MRQIKDGSGRVLGKITETSEGEQAFDANGRYLGKYNESQDRTYTSSGSVYGQGNQLIGLIRD